VLDINAPKVRERAGSGVARSQDHATTWDFAAMDNVIGYQRKAILKINRLIVD